MQSMTIPAGPRNPSGAAEADILAALRGVVGSRRLTFRYELLTSANVKIGDLDQVEDATVELDWLADIKRKATFKIRDTGGIDYLSNRIKPWVRLHLPAGSFVEWPQGVFLLSTPTRQADENGTVTRAVDGYDAGQVFLGDKVIDRHTVLVGANIITAVSTLLGSIPKNITPAPLTLSSSLEWMPGTPKLEIINELLAAANYDSLWFDEDGLAIVRPYVSPADRPSGYTYADDQVSVLNPKVAQQLDLFDVPNRWILVVSDPDWPYIRSVFTNNDPSSPTSTVRRGRTITLYDDQQYAADQATLDGKAARMAFEHSQVYEEVEFETALFPIHSGNDVFRVEYGPLAITGKFNETHWSMVLKAGEPMRHTARRVVQV